MHTSAFWLALPDELVVDAPTSKVEGALHGLGQLLVNVAPLLLMSDPRDLQLSIQVKSPYTERPTVFLWEVVPGGVGFGEHLFEDQGRLLAIARGLLEACECPDGCPACVGPPAAPGLEVKTLVIEVLKVMTTAASDAVPKPEVEVIPVLATVGS
jgi:DEAD/DEAH box helicase domain-containing protein